ncbi:MAG TPA: M18 family aminopeptidase, partial [Byssovorax sp.]
PPDDPAPNVTLGERFPKTPAEMAALVAAGRAAALDLCAFIDASPTPFHAVAEARRRLEAAGFTELDEREPWALGANDRRFVVRGGTTILALVAGTRPPAREGFRMIGAHTDSPCLRVKPNADVTARGYQQVGVEVYGGALYSTWLDRDLSIAGRVMVASSQTTLESRLVRLEGAVARVPNLAIHLNRDVNREGLVLNAQRHLVPVVGLGKEPALKGALAKALGVTEAAVVSWDLALHDTAPSRLGGIDEPFVFAPRLDNLGSSHGALTALLAVADSPAPHTRLVVLYDHEECGSKSAVGAASGMLRDVIGRVLEAFDDGARQAFGRAVARSLFVSADMAHAVHPNYDGQHEPNHTPMLNRGLVIKSNVNQSYATEGSTAAEIELACKEAGFAPQRFVVRTDLPCGSTIGPITAAELGVRTVDVGSPMLSMHSCREMAGAVDVHLAREAYKRALR